MEEDFEIVFNKVKPIVWKLSRYYFIKMWTREDWQQEGMLILHQLLREHPELEEDDTKLYIYFKTLSYEEVGEIEHCLSSGGMQLDEYILFRDSLLAYKQGLSTEKQELFERLVAGEHFLGRQSMLKDLRKKLSDFKEK